MAPAGAPGDPSALPAYSAALVEGWGAGFLVSAGLLLVAGLVMSALVRVSKQAAVAALREAGAGAA